MSHPRRLPPDEDEDLSEQDASWWMRIVFAIGCVGWLAGIFLATCRVVDALKVWVST